MPRIAEEVEDNDLYMVYNFLYNLLSWDLVKEIF